MPVGKGVATLLAGSLLVVASATAAWAGGSLDIEPEDEQLEFEGLAPGISRSSGLTVTNGSDGEAVIALEVEITGNDENGCLRQETRDGDTSCSGPGDGELAEWIEVTVSRDGTSLWTGAIQELESPTTLSDTLGAGRSWDLDIAIGMPFAAGNDTQTDRVAFDLTVHTSATTGEETSQVLGVEGSTSDPTDDLDPVEVGVHAVAAGLSALGPGGTGGAPVVPALVLLAGLLALAALVSLRRQEGSVARVERSRSRARCE